MPTYKIVIDAPEDVLSTKVLDEIASEVYDVLVTDARVLSEKASVYAVYD